MSHRHLMLGQYLNNILNAHRRPPSRDFEGNWVGVGLLIVVLLLIGWTVW